MQTFCKLAGRQLLCLQNKVWLYISQWENNLSPTQILGCLVDGFIAGVTSDCLFHKLLLSDQGVV